MRQEQERRTRVLFLCTGNSCRSQMAEGWSGHLHAGWLEPYSAGTRPTRVDPRAIAVMREVGIEIGGRASKHVDQLVDVQFDWVITVCDHANETCPVFPGDVRRLHAAFDDPPRLAAAAATDHDALGVYRRVRDEIRAFVETLPRRLADPR